MLRVIITWIILTGIIMLIGGIVYVVFRNSTLLLRVCAIVEIIVLCIMKSAGGTSVTSTIVLILGILMCLQYIWSMNKLPKEFRNFYAVKEAFQVASCFLFGYAAMAALLMIPEFRYTVSFYIDNIEWYLYVDIVLWAISIIFVMPKDLKFPKTILKWIGTKDVITQDMIDELIGALELEDDNSDDIAGKVYKTLADFAKQGILEIDDENRCFRRKR